MENLLTIPLLFENLNQKASEQISQAPFKLFLRKFQRNLNKNKIFNNLLLLEQKSKLNPQNIGLNKFITKKMRSKLIIWLQKLCIETFEFHTKTFLLTIRILDRYLSTTNQLPNALQLIGCACLYLASKINESTVVAAQSYLTACCHIFCKNQLFEKESTILKALNYDLSYSCLFKVYNIIMKQIKDHLKINFMQNQGLQIQIKINKLLIQITKNIQFRIFKQYEIIHTIILMIKNGNTLLDSNYLFEILNKNFH